MPFEIERGKFIAELGGPAAVKLMSDEARADALEDYSIRVLDEAVEEAQRSAGAATEPEKFPTAAEVAAHDEGRPYRRGVGNLFASRSPTTRLEPMPVKPTLEDFFRLRFHPANHVLQSATRAMKTGMTEEVILACLLHDTAQALIKVDHGWWGAQLFEPYVPPKTSFAIRYHQALRFYPDAAVGYEYPELYYRLYRHRLHPGAVHRGDLQDGPAAQVVHGAAPGDGERSLRVRSPRRRQHRAVHRHHRPSLQTTEGRARVRQQPGGAHVAEHRVPGSSALTGCCKTQPELKAHKSDCQSGPPGRGSMP